MLCDYAKINKVSAADVLKAAKDIFRPENLNLALVGPFKDKELFEKINELEKKLTTKDEKYIIHGDIHPENVVYDQKKNILNVIDYTDCCLADFARDLGNFHQQLGYMAKDQLTASQITQLQKIFLSSYLKARNIKFTKKNKMVFKIIFLLQP